MTIPDLINGTFEAAGGAFVALNIKALFKHKQVRGASVACTAFFTSWGAWNLFFYPQLNQWLSFWGGLCVFIMNAVCVALMIHYRKN